MAVLAEGPDGTLIRVWVTAGSSQSELAGVHDGRLRARVGSPREKGKATEAVRRLLEESIGARVELVSGMSSRAKVFVAIGSDMENVRRRLGL